LLPAVVAHALAHGLVEVFAQEVQLHLPPAEVGLLAVVKDRVQTIDVLVLTRAARALVRDDKEVVTLAVRVRIVQDTFCALLITSCSAALLNIALEGLRHRVVNDEADIFLVDTHTESNSGDNDLDLVTHPPVLHLLALVVRKLGMIVVTLHLVVAFEDLSEFLAVLPGDTVNDPGLAAEPRLQHLHEVIVDILKLFSVSDFIDKVGTIETRLEERVVSVNL
jgi:hypothetical protein